MSLQPLHISGRNMHISARSMHVRKLLQYKRVCSYCRRTGHRDEECLLRNVESEIDKENVLPKSHVSSPSSSYPLFYSPKYSPKTRKMTKQEFNEVIPQQYWVPNCDPVKLFLNNNTIHNYRIRQHWKKKVHYKQPLL